MSESERNKMGTPPADPMPLYRTLLVLTCVLLGAALTGFGTFLIYHVGPRAGVILCGGLNLFIMAWLVYFQRIKS